MRPLRFEWDPSKAMSNARKHGVTFAEAASAFSDERARVIDDPDHSDDEDRFVLLGYSANSDCWSFVTAIANRMA